VEAHRVQDYRAAREHWLSAAKAGSAAALNNLGYLFFTGKGGDPDPHRGIAFWKEAAARGFPESQLNLGKVFETGKFVPQDLVEAYAWYRCAAEGAKVSTQTSSEQELQRQVGRAANEAISKMLGKLSTDQFISAEQRANRYIRSYALRNIET
jgi:TPR repeat protein